MNFLNLILLFAFQLALLSGQVFSDEFHLQSNLSVYLVSYNVAGESPSEDLSGLFDHFQEKHDIYVVALQELPNSVIITGVDAYMKQLDALFEAKGYVHLEKKRMTVTALYIYVKQNETAQFGNVAKVSTAFDWKKLKGALAIKMTVRDISIVFVGAHFYAFDENYEERIENYNQIVHKIYFNENQNDGIFNQDLQFFLGDLNFRINDLSDEEVLLSIQNKNYSHLLNHDQLSLAKSHGKAFQEFTEASIDFSPTYKFTLHSDTYNLKRKPAYTDRIFYNRNERINLDIQVPSYTSLMDFKGSDHKPVRAIVKVLTL